MNRRTAGAIIVTVAALAMLAVAALTTQGCSGAAPGARAPLDVLGPTPIPSEPLTPAEPPETPISEPEPPPSGGDTPGTPPPTTPGTNPAPPSGVGPEPGAPVSTPPNEGDTGVDPPPAPDRCCGCAGGGEDGWVWMVSTDEDGLRFCEQQAEPVPGLCGCRLLNPGGEWFGLPCPVE